MARVYNFSAGPSMLPEAVLKTAQAELLDYHGSGMSVMEMSHRSKWFDEIITNTEAAMRRVLNIPDNYKVGFFQGGATQQFAMVPLNFMTMTRTPAISTSARTTRFSAQNMSMYRRWTASRWWQI